MMWLSTTKMAKKYGVTSETIRRWIREGKFEEVKKDSLRCLTTNHNNNLDYCSFNQEQKK
jgi:uncharacterized protein YjcR